MQTRTYRLRGAHCISRFGYSALAFVLLYAPLALGQFTLVTGTVVDPNAVPYALGTVTATLITSGTPKFTATGNLYFPPSQATGLNSVGHFLVQLADNTQLTPSGTQWSFQVCSAVGTVQPAFGTGPQCFTAGPITISGSSQDITTTLHAAAVALTLPFGTGTGTVGGSGTTGFVPVWTASSTLGNSDISASLNQIIFGSSTFLAGSNGMVGQVNNANVASCGGSNVSPLLTTNIGCSGFELIFNTNSGTSTGVNAGIFVRATGSNGSTGTLGMAGYFNEAAGFNLTESRALYAEAVEAVSTTVTTRRAVMGFAANETGNTTATNEGGVFQTGTGSASTNTNDYTVHILSPNGTVGGLSGTLTNHVGLQVEDQTQTASGGTNSNPVAIQTVGLAPSKFAGPLISTGTAATLSGTGACATITTQLGGAWVGSAKCTGTTGASTLTITPGATAPNGWVCAVQDQTTRANLFQQTSFTTTTCVLTVSSVTANDVFVFSALAF